MEKQFHEVGARAWSDAAGLSDFDESKTVQSSKDECDINVIVKRFGVTGVLNQSVRIPTFADFDGVFDYQTAMNAVRSAAESFMALPAEIRFSFKNDPQEFVAFCSDPDNLEQLRKWGLAPQKETSVEPPPSPAEAETK